MKLFNWIFFAGIFAKEDWERIPEKELIGQVQIKLIC